MENLQTFSANDFQNIAIALRASVDFYIQDGENIAKVSPLKNDDIWTEKERHEINMILEQSEKDYSEGKFITKEDFMSRRKARIEEFKRKAQ